MTSEVLGDMVEGDFADTCADKFLLTSMGAERRVSRAQTRERGPHRRERNSSSLKNIMQKYQLPHHYYISYWSAPSFMVKPTLR